MSPEVVHVHQLKHRINIELLVSTYASDKVKLIFYSYKGFMVDKAWLKFKVTGLLLIFISDYRKLHFRIINDLIDIKHDLASCTIGNQDQNSRN